jgi:hypothetical protein
VSKAGLLLEYRGVVHFLPASVATGVVGEVELSEIPGVAAQMTLVSGQIVPVLMLGDASPNLVLCDVQGERVGLMGLRLLRSGIFDESTDPEAWSAPDLDVASLVQALKAECNN